MCKHSIFSTYIYTENLPRKATVRISKAKKKNKCRLTLFMKKKKKTIKAKINTAKKQ